MGWSAPLDRLNEWKCSGIIYRRDQDPLPDAEKGMLYAPDVQQGPDGRFYLYYTLDKTN